MNLELWGGGGLRLKTLDLDFGLTIVDPVQCSIEQHACVLIKSYLHLIS